MTSRCECGHYEREHEVLDTAEIVVCHGNTWAWPDDAERQEDGREVRCGCMCFRAHALTEPHSPEDADA
jgi:hypothetical protein